MHRSVRQLSFLVVLLAACSSPPKSEDVPAPPQPMMRPLAQLAAQRVIVTPAYTLLSPDPLGWTALLPKSRDYLRQFDDTLQSVLSERGLSKQWIYPPDLVRAMKGSPTYAVDPYALGSGILRSTAIVSGSRFGDPLATQLRTMIAMQEDARAVLIPVELRFEKEKTGQGTAVLRVALLDGRVGDVRWVGSIRSDPFDKPSPAMLTSLASHLADMVTSP